MFVHKLTLPRWMKLQAHIDRIDCWAGWLVSLVAGFIAWTFVWMLGLIYNFFDFSEAYTGLRILTPICLDKPIEMDDLSGHDSSSGKTHYEQDKEEEEEQRQTRRVTSRGQQQQYQSTGQVEDSVHK